MTYNGFGVAEATPEYEDYASFKKNLNYLLHQIILGMHITRPNEAAKVVPIWIAAEKTVERPDLFAMDEETDVYFDILDNAGAQTFQTVIDYIMIKNV